MTTTELISFVTFLVTLILGFFSKKSNLDLKSVMSKLTMLELEGRIRKISGNRGVIRVTIFYEFYILFPLY